MMDVLFVGVGWTDLALTLNRIAVGAFFMLSGYHKLFNAERHRLFAEASRPVELHHQPLSELSVTLSRHSAPIRQTCRSFQCANVRGDAHFAVPTFVRNGSHASCVL